MPEASDITCRICGSHGTRQLGEVEYITGYRWMVWDCEACGCRFTRHDEAVHDSFHRAGTIAYYDEYRGLAKECKGLFDRKDVAGLRKLLDEGAKYRFVLDELSQLPRTARLLEVGCSRGYLTSWFIMGGWDILGVDVSAEALESARANFGNHFALADSPEVQARAPYDAIYHVGMIGCVRDPIGLTKRLLSLLKPGGILYFNAPNRAACLMKDQLWLDSAPPPDLVTLFPPGFWITQIKEEAVVREGIAYLEPDQAFALHLEMLLGDSWHPPLPQERHDPGNLTSRGAATFLTRARHWLIRGIGMLARITRLSRLAPRSPREFGLYVKMKSRVQNCP